MWFLALSAFIGIVAFVGFNRRGGDGLYVRQILLANYLLSYVISGMVHVWRWSPSRGYYEALAGAPPGRDFGVLNAAVGTLLGLVALIVGLYPQKATPRLTKIPVALGALHPRTSLIAGIVVTVTTLVAAVRVQSVAQALDSERIIAVTGGEARYVILASWLPWGIALITLALADRRRGRGEWRNAFLLVAGAIVITGSMLWSGGRGELVFGIFPLLVVFFPLLGRLKWPAVFVGIAALVPIIASQTFARETNQTLPRQLDIWGLIDWQWGRFSMIAWADRFVSLHGHLGGETFFRGVMAVPNSMMHFLRSDLSFGGRSMVEITGAWFKGTSEQIFIVPGLSAELLANYGMWGIIGGYIILGLISGRLSDWFRDTRFEWTRMWLALLATIIVFQAPIAQFEAFFLTIFYDSLPVVFVIMVERYAGRRLLDTSIDRTGGTSQSKKYVKNPSRPTIIQHRR